MKIQRAMETFQRLEAKKRKKSLQPPVPDTLPPRSNKPDVFVPHRKRKPSEFFESVESKHLPAPDSPTLESEHKKRRYTRRESLGSNQAPSRPGDTSPRSPASSPTLYNSHPSSPSHDHTAAPLLGKKAWMKQFMEQDQREDGRQEEASKSAQPLMASLVSPSPSSTSNFLPLKKKFAQEFSSSQPEPVITPVPAPVPVAAATIQAKPAHSKSAHDHFAALMVMDRQVEALLEIANQVAEMYAKAAAKQEQKNEELTQETRERKGPVEKTPSQDKVKEEPAAPLLLPFQEISATTQTTPLAKPDPERIVKLEARSSSEPVPSKEKVPEIGESTKEAEKTVKAEEAQQPPPPTEPTPSKTRVSFKDYLEKKKHSPIATPPVPPQSAPSAPRQAYFDLPVPAQPIAPHLAPAVTTHSTLPSRVVPPTQEPPRILGSSGFSSMSQTASPVSPPFTQDHLSSWQPPFESHPPQQPPQKVAQPSWEGTAISTYNYADNGTRKSVYGTKAFFFLFFSLLFFFSLLYFAKFSPFSPFSEPSSKDRWEDQSGGHRRDEKDRQMSSRGSSPREWSGRDRDRDRDRDRFRASPDVRDRDRPRDRRYDSNSFDRRPSGGGGDYEAISPTHPGLAEGNDDRDRVARAPASSQYHSFERKYH